MNDNRDSIDFGKTDIPRLFVKLFIPTLMGMIFMAVFNIADGIIVGRGVGGDALAAVNIAAPIFLLSSATSLMFASGVSIVGAIHLSHGNVKAANINVTQAFLVPLILMVLLAIASLFLARPMGFLFGGSEALMPYVENYLHWVSLSPVFTVILIVGGFVIRLDGSPKYAMYLNVFPSLLNIFLDWYFVFPLHMGIMGAALATSITMGVGAVMVGVYMFHYHKTLRIYRLKLSKTSLRLTWRNAGYMSKLGFSTFIGEASISGMMIVGNYMFISRLHEAGVAAFSVCCYLLPLIFMFGTSIANSQMPIVSYNYGLGDKGRIRSTIKISLGLGTLCGISMTVLGIIFCRPLVSLFLETGTDANTIALAGFPMFALSFLFFTLNIISIGIYQSLEHAREAIIFTLLRGFIFVIPLFIFLPGIIDVPGLWLAVPISEATTFLVIAIFTFCTRGKTKA